MDSKKASEKLERQLSSVRNRKIQKLKNRISSGKYHIDTFCLAKALFLSR